MRVLFENHKVWHEIVEPRNAEIVGYGDMPLYLGMDFTTIKEAENLPGDRTCQVFINDCPHPTKILRNPSKKATTVFWSDGDKTVVRLADGEADDPFAAFCYALAIKSYGSNSAVKRMVNQKTETIKKKEKKDAGSEQN